MTMKIATGSHASIYIVIQTVIEHNLKFAPVIIPKRQWLSFALAGNRLSLSTRQSADQAGVDEVLVVLYRLNRYIIRLHKS